MTTELTEDEIQQQLAREYVTGSQYFRGKPLAKWTLGLRDLVFKVVNRADTPEFHDACALHILTEAAAETFEKEIYTTTGGLHKITVPSNTVTNRARLIRETDDVETFRAEVSIELDDWTAEDMENARATVHAILTLAENARVEVTKKKEAADAAAQLPTQTSSESASSPNSPDSPSTPSDGT